MFSSKTWLELGTLQLLAAMGYKTVAADIPGYGNSPQATVPTDFVHLLVKQLSLVRPVVISPSLSGYYTLPYLVSHWKEMGAFVPVAPQGWEVLEHEKECLDGNPGNISNVPNTLKQFLPSTIPDLSCLKVPTLVVYGEHDRARNSALLSLLPWSQAVEIPDGKHPAYLDNPKLWHQLLFNFLGYVTGSIASVND